MKECECTKNKKIRPFDSCIYCAHKHASAALALSSVFEKNILIKLRIISQLNLSMWHLNKSYFRLINSYKNIINKILRNDEYKSDLTNLVEFLWENKDNNINDVSTNETNYYEENTLINGVILLSNALELLRYEYSYRNINYSYAIGQLNLAMWCFQDINQIYAGRCRELYKSIEIDKIDHTKFEFLILQIINENSLF